jgi:hypothetical protein
LQRHKSGQITLTPGELAFLGTFNPLYDYGRASSAAGSRKNLRRSKGYFENYMTTYCNENMLVAFAPKLNSLRANFKDKAGKQLIACADKRGYNISAAICAMLEGCLGFRRLDLGPAVRLPGKPSTEAMAKALLASLGGKRHRRFFCTKQIQEATDSLHKRRALWDVVKSVHVGVFNSAQNREGALLECVITHETTFNEGVSIRLLRNVHLFDVMPMDSLAQVIGRGQRPGSFSDEPNPNDRLMKIYLYPSRWDQAQQEQLYKYYAEKTGQLIRKISGGDKWVKELKKRLLYLRDTPGIHSYTKSQADTATLALQQFLHGNDSPPTLPLTGDLILKTVTDFQGVLRMYVALMSVSVNCVASFAAHKRYGQLPGGLALQYKCREESKDDDATGLDDRSSGTVVLEEPEMEPPTMLQRLLSLTFRGSMPTPRELASDELIMKGMRDQYGDSAAPAAYEIFQRIVEDALMADPWTGKRMGKMEQGTSEYQLS